MKKLAYNITFLILVTVVVVAACEKKNELVNNNVGATITNRNPIPSPTTETRQSVSSADLETIRKYAESYEPKSGREVIPSPPVPDEKVLKIVTDLASSNSLEHEKYILLIFLRLSRFQIEHFKQRYELGRENPFTREFYRLIGETNYDKAELMSASLADNYVEKHPELLDYPLINAEIKRIRKAEQKIEDSVKNN